MRIEITQHAFRRARQRMGWHPMQLVKRTYSAWRKGQDIEDMPQQARARCSFGNVTHGSEAIYHLGVLFIFKGNTLITIYE